MEEIINNIHKLIDNPDTHISQRRFFSVHVSLEENQKKFIKCLDEDVTEYKSSLAQLSKLIGETVELNHQFQEIDEDIIFKLITIQNSISELIENINREYQYCIDHNSCNYKQRVIAYLSTLLRSIEKS